MAREAGIRMISLPPHTTHRLQPLDVAFFGPLGTYYDEAARTWMRQHPGRAVTSWQVAELFGSAYCKAASVGTAVSGFRASGLWPLDIGVFSDCDFAASAVTDVCSNSESGANDQVGAEVVVPTPLNTTDSQTIVDNGVNQVAAVPVGDAQFHAAGVSADVVSEPAPVDDSTIAQLPDTNASPDVSSDRPTTTQPVPSGRFYKTRWNKTHEAPNVVPSSDRTIHSVHVSDISPAPVMKESQSCRRKRRADHAADVTSTPYKKALENTPSGKKAVAKKRLLVAEQESNNLKQGKIKAASTAVKNGKTKSKDSVPKSVHGSTTKKKKTSERRAQKQEQKMTDNSGDIWICHDCNVEYGDKDDTRLTEDWITCETCAKCFHMSCAENSGVVDDDESFVCKDCLY